MLSSVLHVKLSNNSSPSIPIIHVKSPANNDLYPNRHHHHHPPSVNHPVKTNSPYIRFFKHFKIVTTKKWSIPFIFPLSTHIYLPKKNRNTFVCVWYGEKLFCSHIAPLFLYQIPHTKKVTQTFIIFPF